jgi:glycosyltransferase involved in cell wall biosynthesis
MPVVTTKVGGIPFLFEDGKEGIMVEKQSAEALSEAILALKNSTETVASISVAARRKAEEWDWEVVRKMWIDTLNK